MPVDGEITEVTAPVEFAIVDDRLHFTLVSGSQRRTYAITFHKARNAAQGAVSLLDQRERESRGSVRKFRRGVGSAHG